KTIRIDDTKPDLQTIKINETFVNWAANWLQTLTYDLFFKQILVTIDVTYDKSGRHSSEGLAYQMVAQTAASMPQADPDGWTQLQLSSKIFAFSEDFRGVLFVKAMDKAGNLSDTWLTHGFMSDVTEPDLTLNASADGAFHNQTDGWTADSPDIITTAWLNAPVTVTVDAADLVGGINTLNQVTYAITTASGSNQTAETVLYQASAAIDPASAPEGMLRQTLTLEADDTYTLVATAIDRSGNISTRTLVIRIDQIAPLDEDVIIAINGTDIALAEGETGAPLYLTNSESALIDAVQAAQISGIAAIEYQVVEQGETISDTWAVYSSEAVFKTALDAWSNRIFTLPVRVTDQAGNQTEITSSVVYLDNTRPTVSVSGNPADWTDQDVTLVVIAHDYTQFGNADSGIGSDLPALAYRYTFNGVTGDWTDAASQTYDANGTVQVEVRDHSGNIETQTVIIDRIDKLAPDNGSIEYVDQYTADHWYNSSQVIRAAFLITEGTAGFEGSEEWLQFSIDAGQTWTDADSFTVDTSERDQSTTTVMFRVIDELDRTFTIKSSAIVNLDTTAPVAESIRVLGQEPDQAQQSLRELLQGMTLGLFFDKTLIVSVQADTAALISGVAKIRTYVSDHEKPQAIGVNDAVWSSEAGKVYTGPFTLPINDPRRGIIYVQVTDKAGNQTVITTELVVVDATKPSAPFIQARILADGQTGDSYQAGNWINQDVQFALSGSGNTVAGVDRYEYATRLAGETAWSDWQIAIEDTFTQQVSEGHFSDLEIKFRAVSRTGIEGEETVFGWVRIDKDTPAPAGVTIDNGSGVEVSPNQDTWYKDNTLTVRVTQDAGQAPVTAWYQIDSGDWTQLALTTNVGTIQLQQGVQTVRVRTLDDAGNYDTAEAEIQTHQVLVDQGVPTLTVTPKVGTAEAAYKGGYTNEQVRYELKSESVAPFLKLEVYKNNEQLE
ncbi:MAG: hypothetical protein EOM70_12220, partial [Clostridia bacterium]|nr:hypothetical protein [Clostridia bacterium]